MFILAELIGRPLSVSEYFAPGIVATATIIIFYALSCTKVMPLYYFIGFLSFYLGWSLLSILMTPGSTHRPLGGYISLSYCVVACIVAVIIARHYSLRGGGRKNEYKAIGIGILFVVVILSMSIPAVL
ncbi:MAG: hypothetical protein WC657_07755 [Candidatus Paceibacterota bacterium]|jgi:hypothetical protein